MPDVKPDTEIAAEFLGSNDLERAQKCRALAAQAGELAAEASNPITRKTYLDLQRQWQQLADEIENGQAKWQQPEERRDFVKQGGKVAKLQAAIPVSASEVIAYLASHGIKVKYSGVSNTYVCNRARCTVADLVELANVRRRAENLPPFAATIRYAGRGS